MTLLLALANTPRLVPLSTLDYVIVVFYFVLVLAVDFCWKLLPVGEMAAWVAGLSLPSAERGVGDSWATKNCCATSAKRLRAARCCKLVLGGSRGSRSSHPLPRMGDARPHGVTVYL